MPESSELGPIASTLGLVVPEFSCRGIPSGLQIRDLARMRAKYHILNTFSLVISGNYFWACTLQLEFVVFYEDAFLAGALIRLHLLA